MILSFSAASFYAGFNAGESPSFVCQRYTDGEMDVRVGDDGVGKCTVWNNGNAVGVRVIVE